MMYDYKLHLIIRTPRACPWEQSDLKQSLYEWKEQIPYYVGIIVVNVERRSKWVAKRPAPMEVSAGMKFMLRQSLIRTLFYQNDKLKKNSAAKIEQICQETEK